MLIWRKNLAGKFLNGSAVIKVGHFRRIKKCHVVQIVLLRCGTISQWSVIQSFSLWGPVSGDFGLCLRLLCTCTGAEVARSLMSISPIEIMFDVP